MFKARFAVATVIFAALTAAFFGAGHFLPFLKLQFGAVFDRLFLSYGHSALFAVMGILLTALLFGRFYCSVLCPFGYLQDLIAFIFRRKGKIEKNRPFLRYGIALVCIGLLAAGSSIGVRILGPLTNFGRILTQPLTIGAAVFVIITVLVVWKGRIFCTALCPVGTVLGVFSKKPVCRMTVSDKCIQCGRCVAVCQAGCIEPQEERLDNERCVRCLQCMSVCPVKAVGFGGKGKKETAAAADAARRRFILGGSAAVAAVAAGSIFKMFSVLSVQKGAAWVDRRACVGCGRCVRVCPLHAIHMEDGLAAVSPFKCVGCGACLAVCPVKAISIVLRHPPEES